MVQSEFLPNWTPFCEPKTWSTMYSLNWRFHWKLMKLEMALASSKRATFRWCLHAENLYHLKCAATYAPRQEHSHSRYVHPIKASTKAAWVSGHRGTHADWNRFSCCSQSRYQGVYHQSTYCLLSHAETQTEYLDHLKKWYIVVNSWWLTLLRLPK